MRLLVAIACLRSVVCINWEVAQCLAVSGNRTGVLDGEPEQLRVVPGRNASSYVLSWVSQLTLQNNADLKHEPNNDWPQLSAASNHGQTFRSCLAKSEAKWGADPDRLTARGEAAARLYTEPMCGTTRMLHAVPTYDIDATKPLYYSVRSFGGKWSEVRSFVPLGVPDEQSRVTGLFTFDMGSRDADDHNKLCLESAVPALVAEIQAGTADFGVHGGDTGYNIDDNCGTTGDFFFRDLQGAIDSAPYIFTNGNHETGFDRSYDPFVHRFADQLGMGMRSRSGSARYFSFEAGPVHFVVLDADPWTYYQLYGLAGAQFLWLTHDLSKVNRSKTPWVVVATHRPLYAQDNELEQDAMINGIRDDVIDVPEDVYMLDDLPPAPPDMPRHWALEPLFLEHRVDLVLSGHVHRYQRSFPVIQGVPVQLDYHAPSAPVHVMAGNGGCGGMDHFEGVKPQWEAYRDMLARPGYGRLIADRSSLRWEMRGIDGVLFDNFTIEHGSVKTSTV